MIDERDAALALENVAPGLTRGVTDGCYRAKAGNDYASHPLIVPCKKEKAAIKHIDGWPFPCEFPTWCYLSLALI
jgi:hypothetical protein